MVSAMAAGETRRANLDMLVEKAVEYENTSYKGLFHFIRYIENLKKYHSDFGEASVVGEEENTVRIMSIHKSKGLEFPVVFLAGMGKNSTARTPTAACSIYWAGNCHGLSGSGKTSEKRNLKEKCAAPENGTG